jgi:hypothetical protein
MNAAAKVVLFGFGFLILLLAGGCIHDPEGSLRPTNAPAPWEQGAVPQWRKDVKSP